MQAVRFHRTTLLIGMAAGAAALSACEKQAPEIVEPLVLTPAAASLEAAESRSEAPEARRAATGRITGVVIAQGSGQPVADSRVIVRPGNRGTLTAHNGRFFLINVPPGTYSLLVQRAGYEPETAARIVVRAGETTVRNVELRSEG